MSRISIVTPDKSSPRDALAAITGKLKAKAYFCGESDPVHLHELSFQEDETLEMQPHTIDRVGYVWKGQAQAGGYTLPIGSSFIVERGASLSIQARAASCTLLLFAAGRASTHLEEGGHVHLLPADRVPRSGLKGTMVSGAGLHADGTCATCEIWLQESVLPGMAAAPPDEENATGIHAHAEDEIIFVTRGQIRLGTKLYGPGTALEVHADTLYSFSPGPEGMEFLTFRPAKPGGIRFGKNSTMSAPTHWKDFPSPAYIAPVD